MEGLERRIAMIIEESSLLRRPRVDSLLERALEKPLVAITAGPGCGKTCAVQSFLQSGKLRTVWVRLSEADNHPARFWENFANAVGQHSATLAEAIRGQDMPVNQGELFMFAAALIDEIKPRYRYALVFDDLHLIREDSVRWFIRALAYGMWSGRIEGLRPRNPGAGNCIVLISREDCGFDSEKLVAEGRMAQIGESELNFTKSETLELFRFIGVPATPALQTGLSSIYDDTKGWAFLTGVAGRLLQKRPDGIKYIRNTLRHNVSLIIENELFLHNSPEMNKFLAKLSLIDFLSAELISMLENGDKLIKELTRYSSLIRYDAYLNVYHIHHLMEDFLLKLREELTEEEKRGVYQAAAEWCMAHEYKMDAAGYCAKAGNYNAVIGIIYQFPQIIPFDKAALLLDILDGAPASLAERIPWLYSYRGRLLLSLGKTDQMIEELQAVIQREEPLEPTQERRRILLGAYYLMGNAHMLTCNNTGDYGFAEEFRKAESYLRGSGFSPMGSMRVATVAPYAVRIGRKGKGEPEKYIRALEASVPHVSRIMDGCLYGSDDLAWAELAYFQTDIAKCKQYSMQALFKAREKQQYEIESRALFFLMKTALAGGKYQPVKDAILQMDAQLAVPEFINRHIRYDIQTGWFYGIIGQKEPIAEWLKNDFSVSHPKTVIADYEDIARCKYYLMENNYSAMLAMIGSRTGEFDIGRYLFGQIGLAVHLAVCLYNLKDKQGAFEVLRQAYELASPNGLDMIFIELGNRMRTLAAAAQKIPGCGIPKDWLEMIQKKAATYAKRAGQVKTQYRLAEGIDDGVQLTPKEMDLIRDISHGLSRTEIALARDISINTVKMMLQYIYEKLGAENSIDAIRIAFARGIL